MWRPLITVEVNYHFVRTYGLDHYRRKLLADANFFDRAKPDSGYFANPKRLVDTSSMTDSVHGVKQAHHLESDEFPGLLTLIRQGKLGLALICYPVLAYRARHFLGLLVLFKAFRDAGLAGALSLLADYVRTTGNKLIKTGSETIESKSLRKLVNDDLSNIDGDSLAMEPLRKGR